MPKITGIEISSQRISEIQKEVKNILDFKKIIKSSLGAEISSLLEIILIGGVSLRVSDLHIEPQKNQARIRCRIDGILQDILFFEPSVYQSLLSRIKLLSGLKLNVSDKAQDGRFSIILQEQTSVEIRTSTLPAEYGESVVLRILNPKNLIGLEALGLRQDMSDIFQKEIKKPNGMILVTGPTGSGKTTTLYAFLKSIQKPEIKIITIEDPIEYHLNGISQTQVNPKKGYGFADGLKSIMRQDPNVILVGEIRDLETAKIALQAALTGHLVFATLHTNDAIGAISRLNNLGANLADIASAINLIIAQQLVRRVCRKCLKMKTISSKELEKLKKGLAGVSKEIKIPAISKDLKIPEANEKGCNYCNFTGYQGRIGIFESFLIDEEMEKLILESPPASVLKKEAVKKGMVTIYQDGLIKVLEGITTLEEIERIIGK